MVFPIQRDGYIVVTQQVEHAIDKRRYKQRHVARGSVYGVHAVGQQSEPRCQSFQGATIFATIVRDGNLAGQGGQLLVWRSYDNYVFARNTFADQSHYALQHQFRSEGQRCLIAAHTTRFAAAENDRSFSHDAAGSQLPSE
jgi:hypothetical protein